MNIKEYKAQCKRTCPSLGSSKLDLSHMVMGILTEIRELSYGITNKDSVNIGEEIADIYWYLINYVTFRDLDITEIEPFYYVDDNYSDPIKLLYGYTSDLTDYIKKFTAYNREFDKEEEMNIILDINSVLQYLISLYKLSFSTILQNNIDKLKVRFPDKFDEEKANNRDLDSERRELEK